MKRQAIVYRNYIRVVIVACCLILPVPVWFIFNSWFDTSNHESRTLADFPHFEGSIEYYIDGIKLYFTDNLPYKNYLSPLNSLIDYKLYHVSSSNRVVIGKEGWLFFAQEDAGDPIASYEGRDSFSEQEVLDAIKDFSYIQERMDNDNIGFCLVVPANKENVYSQFMPDYYRYTAESRTERLVRQLNNNGVNAIFLKGILQSNPIKTYYKYDTHWNQVGGYISATEIMRSWHLDVEDIRECNVTESLLSKNYHYAGIDDLAEILNLRDWIFFDEKEYHVEGTVPVVFDELQAHGKELMIYTNENSKYDKRCLLIGDSFRAAMIPSLQSYFRELYVVTDDYYKKEYFVEINPDYVIYECVERYSPKLLEVNTRMGFY